MQADDFFDIAQSYFDDALPFVLYRKPHGRVVKGLFQENDTVYDSDNLTESGFVFAPFEAQARTVLIPSNTSEALECAFKSEDLNEASKAQKVKKDANASAEVKAFHMALVSKAIKTIASQALQKVVLSRKEKVTLIENNPIALFKRLLAQYPTAFTYCWYHPKIGLWLGATPETLLSITGKRFTTMALAGTQAYTGNDATTWASKETEEQQLVTNFIVDNLKDAVSNLSVGQKQTVKAGNLLHLKTPITGLLNTDVKTIVTILHPTPAICGLPKNQAKQFILDNENYKRTFYTGYLGELNIKEKTTRNTNRRNVENNAYATVKTVSNLFVNLRCMELTDVHATVYVGGGITKDSNPENEWKETVNKTQTMKKVLF